MTLRRRLQKAWRRVIRFVWGDYKRGGFVGLYHWIRCHTWNRYHIINISEQDDYNWGWIDRDHAMLLSCFKLLQDFVERERPNIGLLTVNDFLKKEDDDCPGEGCTGSCRRRYIEDQLKQENEIRALYTWWTVDRPLLKAENERILHDLRVKNLMGELWCKAQEQLDTKDEEMLLRLMKIRGCLWS